MKIPDAKAAVDKEWKKLETVPAWNLEQVKSREEVILEAQRDKKNVHFVALMEICHLKNVELEPILPKYKGRVVLQGNIVKDNSEACAVFTEQGSSASQMTAAKVMDGGFRAWPTDKGSNKDMVRPLTLCECQQAKREKKKTDACVSAAILTHAGDPPSGLSFR